MLRPTADTRITQSNPTLQDIVLTAKQMRWLNLGFERIQVLKIRRLQAGAFRKKVPVAREEYIKAYILSQIILERVVFMHYRGAEKGIELPLCPRCGMDSGTRKETIKGDRFCVVCGSCGCRTKLRRSKAYATRDWIDGLVS